MSDKPTINWDESKPSGTRDANLGDDDIREMKTQIREVIDVDHDFPSSGKAADVGQHKQVTLQEQADLGTGAVGTTILGNQTVGGKGELVYTDEDDNDVQMTKQGKNYAGLVKDGATTDTNAAPTVETGISNKKYVDDAIAAALAALTTIPSGLIAVWSGAIAAIPTGWVLCNGSNGTPDLRDKFVLGAGNLASPGDSGGLTLSGSGSSIKSTTDTNSMTERASGGSGNLYGSHTHNAMPPYYAVAYIQKV